MSFLKKIKSQSPTAKAHISFWSAFVVVGIIALMWTATLPSQLSQNAPIAETAKETVGPFGSFFGNIRNQLGAVFSASSTDSVSDAKQEAPSDPVEDPQLVPVLDFDTTRAATVETAPSNVVLIGTSSSKTTPE